MENNKTFCRDFLIEQFNEKKIRNPRYSIRAFARDLDITPSCLTRVLNGERDLSPFQAYKLAQHMKLSESESLKLIVAAIEN